jgi:hypothetical protein
MTVTTTAAPLTPAASRRMATGPMTSGGGGDVGVVVSVDG